MVYIDGGSLWETEKVGLGKSVISSRLSPTYLSVIREKQSGLVSDLVGEQSHQAHKPTREIL